MDVCSETTPRRQPLISPQEAVVVAAAVVVARGRLRRCCCSSRNIGVVSFGGEHGTYRRLRRNRTCLLVRDGKLISCSSWIRPPYQEPEPPPPLWCRRHSSRETCLRLDRRNTRRGTRPPTPWSDQNCRSIRKRDPDSPRGRVPR